MDPRTGCHGDFPESSQWAPRYADPTPAISLLPKTLKLILLIHIDYTPTSRRSTIPLEINSPPSLHSGSGVTPFLSLCIQIKPWSLAKQDPIHGANTQLNVTNCCLYSRGSHHTGLWAFTVAQKNARARNFTGPELTY